MEYKDLLSQYIKESGLTLRQIANECEKLGVLIDPSTISRIQTGKMPPPSEEVSKTIATVCNQDPEKLILQGYIDKAPKHIQDLLRQYETRWSNILYLAYQNSDPQNTTLEKFCDEIDKIPVEKQALALWNYITKNPFTDNEMDFPLLLKIFEISEDFTTANEIGHKWKLGLKNGRYKYWKVPGYIIGISTLENCSLLVSEDEQPENRDTIIAKVNGKYIIGDYFNENNTVLVLQENKEPILVRPDTEFEILGVVIATEYSRKTIGRQQNNQPSL